MKNATDLDIKFQAAGVAAILATRLAASFADVNGLDQFATHFAGLCQLAIIDAAEYSDHQAHVAWIKDLLCDDPHFKPSYRGDVRASYRSPFVRECCRIAYEQLRKDKAVKNYVAGGLGEENDFCPSDNG